MRSIRIGFFFALTIIPAQLQLVRILPSKTIVSAPGRDLTFQCSSLSSEVFTSVRWLVNGTFLENLNLPNTEALFFDDVGVGFLRFQNIEVSFNMTSIRCIATLSSGGGQFSSSSTLILLQGSLGNVEDLTLRINGSDIIITWTPPPSLDVMEIPDDDLSFLITVTNATSQSTIQSVRGVTENEFVYPIPTNYWCTVIVFTVIPVNLAGNGTPSEIDYVPQVDPPLISKVVCSLVTASKRRIYEYTLIMTSPVCFVDQILVFDDVLNESPNVTIAGNNVTFTSHLLILNRIYNVSVLARNIAGSRMSHTTIRTSDIADVQISNSGGIAVSFCENSHSGGTLFFSLFNTKLSQ